MSTNEAVESNVYANTERVWKSLRWKDLHRARFRAMSDNPPAMSNSSDLHSQTLAPQRFTVSSARVRAIKIDPCANS